MAGLSGNPHLRSDELWAEAGRWAGVEEPTAALRLRRFAGWTGALGALGPEYWGGWQPPKIQSYNCLTGDVNQVRRGSSGKVVGVGSGHAWSDRAHAAHVAICEGLERYAASIYDPNQLIHSRAADLGSEALDLGEIASFSSQEIANLSGFIGTASKASEIRWTLGVDLRTGGEVLVPAVMVYALTERLPSERFWLPFSTGTAIHETPVKALLAALCEIIERDACAITWLQQLPLPALSDECLSERAREIIDWFDQRGVETFLFDATTDLGVSVVWCTQFSPYGKHTSQTTATACSLDQRDAALKALMECSRFIPAIEATPARQKYADFDSINSSAAYLGMRSQRPAFDFLVSGYDERERAKPRLNEGDLDPDGGLRRVLERLFERGYSVYAVDLTTREVSEAGLSCVRVIVPQAQPLSVWPLAQYRGSARLYEAPRLLGHRVRTESDLNPYPVPVT